MKCDHDTYGLKHCPFCGNAAKIRKIVRSDSMCSFDDWHIYCTSCRAEMNIPADNYYGREYFTKEQAVTIWNERVNKEVENADKT